MAVQPDRIECIARRARTFALIRETSASSIRNRNQFQIVRRKDFPYRVLHFHSNRFSGAFVQNLKTFLAAGEEITFSPLAQSNDNRKQLSAFLGQGIFPVGTAVRSRHLFHDSARNQLLKARAQDVLCQSQALLKIGEASYAREGVTNDQQRPPFADGIERACHGAQVGSEGFVSHSSSYLIAPNLVASLYQMRASHGWLHHATRLGKGWSIE